MSDEQSGNQQQQATSPAQAMGGPGSKRDLCLLSLDGGGVRGLSSLLILQKLMESINPENPPKPCDYFDMIGGTSTGGLIALLLGRLRLTVEECIEEYEKLSPVIFTQKHKSPVNMKLNVQGRFNTEGFEKSIQDLIERVGPTHKKDELLKENVAKVASTESKVFVVATGNAHAKPVVFSNYYSERRGGRMRNVVKIWEAARATSAAPSFFEPITIKGQSFGDGGTGANNPIDLLWSEATDTFKDPNDPNWNLSDNLQCLVSIGTGKLLLKEITTAPMDVVEALKGIVTDTEEKAEEFERRNDILFNSADKRAFRFNVTSGLEEVGLEEVKKMDKIEAITDNYIRSQATFASFKTCSNILRQREWFHRLRILVENSTTEPKSVSTDGKFSQELYETCLHTSVYRSWLDKGPRLQLDTAGIKFSGSSCENPAATLAYAMVSNKQQIDGLQPYFCYFNSMVSESQPGSTPISAQSILRSFILQILIRQDGSNQIDEELVDRLEERNHGQTLRKISLSNGNPSPNDLAELFQEIAFAKDACLVIVLEGYDLIPKSILEVLRGVMWMKSPHRLLLSTRSPRKIEVTIHERTEYLECCRSLQRNVQANGRRDQIDNPVPGTLDWLWNHEAYTGWNHRKSGILFIQGKPGSGKSVLAKAISNGYENSLAHDPEEDLPLMSSWFYSTRGGPVAQLHESLLQAVILQWLDQDAELWSTIRPFWRESFAAQTFSTFKTLSGVLEKVVSTGRKVMTIVDAIDESNSDPNHNKGAQSGGAVQRKDILEKFQELVSRIPNSSAKFIILSRPIRALAELQAKQTTPDYFMITMEQENQDALSLVIDHSLEKLKRQILEEKGKDGALSFNEKASFEHVKSYLTKNSDGVILWPKLIANDLASALEEGDDIFRNLTKRLESCPRDLTELYKEMVRRVASSKSNNPADAQQLLMWISGSAVAFERPITLGALYETSWISSYEDNRSSENPFSQDAASDGSLVKFERRLRQLCGTFINVQRKTEFVVHRTDTVELGHRTMKDFLAGPDAGHLQFAQEDALDLIYKQSGRYFNILKECLDRRKDRATSSDPGADLKHSIWEFFGLIEKRMFLDLGCTPCETGSSHKDGLHCPREMLGRSIEALETTFESVVESSTAAGLAAISKTFKPEQDKEKARERDRLLNDLLPISAFLTREESPTAVNWEKRFSTYLPEKQRELLNADKSLFLAELIYWACMLGEPATTANLIQPFLWRRFSNNQPTRSTPYRTRFLDLVRTSIVAVVDTGLDRIFYDHLFEYPVLLYTITERMQQLKHNGVEHEESMKCLRKWGRSVLKSYLEENQQHSHDFGTSQDVSNAHGTLLRGQEERTEDDQAKMQHDLRNIYATLNSMAANIRRSRHDDLRNDELKLANICEAVSLVLREAETLLIRVTHYQDSSGELLAPPDISALRNRHDWKKYIRERSVAGRFGIHPHILGAVDRVACQESDFARFWPKEKPIKLAEDLAREENGGERERETPRSVVEGSRIDLRKRVTSFSKGWGRK